MAIIYKKILQDYFFGYIPCLENFLYDIGSKQRQKFACAKNIYMHDGLFRVYLIVKTKIRPKYCGLL